MPFPLEKTETGQMIGRTNDTNGENSYPSVPVGRVECELLPRPVPHPGDPLEGHQLPVLPGPEDKEPALVLWLGVLGGVCLVKEISLN